MILQLECHATSLRVLIAAEVRVREEVALKKMCGD
jgi:hypothetical protein